MFWCSIFTILCCLFSPTDIVQFTMTKSRRHVTTPCNKIIFFMAMTILSVVMTKRNSYSVALTTADQFEILNVHNALRRVEGSSNMLLMLWNPSLAITAQNWTDNCDWQRGQGINSSKLSELGIGQNLYVIKEPPINLTTAVTFWFREKSDYSYTRNTCTSPAACTRYTQVVWANTYQVGCGYTVCPTMKNLDWTGAVFLVCNYYPAGNIVGKQPYAKGSPCSECPDGYSKCVDGLCAYADLDSVSSTAINTPDSTSIVQSFNGTNTAGPTFKIASASQFTQVNFNLSTRSPAPTSITISPLISKTFSPQVTVTSSIFTTGSGPRTPDSSKRASFSTVTSPLFTNWTTAMHMTANKTLEQSGTVVSSSAALITHYVTSNSPARISTTSLDKLTPWLAVTTGSIGQTSPVGSTSSKFSTAVTSVGKAVSTIPGSTLTTDVAINRTLTTIAPSRSAVTSGNGTIFGPTSMTPFSIPVSSVSRANISMPSKTPVTVAFTTVVSWTAAGTTRLSSAMSNTTVSFSTSSKHPDTNDWTGQTYAFSSSADPSVASDTTITVPSSTDNYTTAFSSTKKPSTGDTLLPGTCLINIVDDASLHRQPQSTAIVQTVNKGDIFVYLGADRWLSDGSYWLSVALLPTSWPIGWIDARFSARIYSTDFDRYRCSDRVQ